MYTFLLFSSMQPGIFQVRGGFLEYGHFDKPFMYGIQKSCPAEEIFVLSLQDSLKSVFLIRI